MEQHAPELLQIAALVIKTLGSLIVALFIAGVGLAKWAATRYEGSQISALLQINKRLDNQDAALTEIKEFMTAEIYELREWFHRLDKDMIILKERNGLNHD
jgi:HAMP domain-containing protein